MGWHRPERLRLHPPRHPCKQHPYRRAPKNFSLPLAIVQHRSADAGNELQFALQDGCALRVREACDKDAIEPGTVTLAPPNYHLLVEVGLILSN